MKATVNNNKEITNQVIATLSDDARRWVKRNGTITTYLADKSLDRNLSDKQMAHYVHTAYGACVAAYNDAMQAEADRKARAKADKAAARAKAKHEREMNACVDDPHRDTYYNVLRTLRWGENWGKITAQYSDHNGVTCDVYKDYDGYARSCQWTMTRRDFRLEIKKSYRVRVVGGLITFFRGKYDRTGMACEWVEQGRALDDIITVKGYLVRGEHIQAKSLAEAKRVNASHRNEQLSAILRNRTEHAAKIEAIKDYRVTVDDSLACGNCRPGTQAFRRRYEAAIGHEVDSITAADLDKYGRRFGVSYYTDRLVNYIYDSRK